MQAGHVVMVCNLCTYSMQYVHGQRAARRQGRDGESRLPFPIRSVASNTYFEATNCGWRRDQHHAPGSSIFPCRGSRGCSEGAAEREIGQGAAKLTGLAPHSIRPYIKSSNHVLACLLCELGFAYHLIYTVLEMRPQAVSIRLREA